MKNTQLSSGNRINLAIVTNNELHHNYFASELNKYCKVKCIIIPKGDEVTTSILAKIKQYGFFIVLLKIISKVYQRFSKKSLIHSFNKARIQYFNNAKKDFEEIDCNKIHYVQTVNSDSSIKIITDNEIDIICFLGGDIAKNKFINSAKIACFNIHSGISPFYNGSGTTAWSVVDCRPNFSGVTLMKMNERIDGGDIISHYLPEITENDNAGTLFMKGIIGAVELVKNEIKNYEKNIHFEGIKQNKSFKYTKGIDWNFYHDLRLNWFYKSGRMKLYERNERFFYYHDKGTENFQFPYSEILSYILS
jgi:folate-dependent phosphoribosylglycinamide formyltransferase PurN